MALTESDIANLALLHLGDKGSINVLATDTTPEARKLRALFEVRRDALLRSYPWNFATNRIGLSTALAPVFGYSYQHTLPSDCLRVLSVNGMPAGASRAKFATEAGKLLIDASYIELVYVAKITNPALWSALFVQVFALDLAAAAALGLTQSSQRRQELQAEMFTLLREAKGTDAMESSAWVIMPDEDPDTFNVRNFGVWPEN